MNSQEMIREKIIETAYHLTNVMLNENLQEIERLKAELYNLIEQYKYNITK